LSGETQLGLGLKTAPRPLVLARKIATVPLEWYRLPKDGRKWKSTARQRMQLALWLAVHGDPDGSRIYPSVESMARCLSCSRRFVFYLLEDLEAIKLLYSEGLTSERGTRRRRMDLSVLPEAGVQDSRAGVQDSRAGVQNRTCTQPVLTVQTEKQNLAAQTAASLPFPAKGKPQQKTTSQERYGNVRKMLCEAAAILARRTQPGRRWPDANCRDELKEWAARNGIPYDGEAISKAFDVAEGRIRDADRAQVKTMAAAG
jgi:hypothetical protein